MTVAKVLPRRISSLTLCSVLLISRARLAISYPRSFGTTTTPDSSPIIQSPKRTFWPQQVISAPIRLSQRQLSLC